ncbi:MAG: endonuclease [Candidatus Yonathbacteria bacterium CG10_big_fil_rev_8_21_14_0_10_43_136]|uniref:Endonuclease n=1 Tax=Candidatus Yonathbacteria bacterium CG_4_10_14_0_8_um_filter_43_17 TaxID=1975099 RepID=A0A2M7Q4S7_9BACT|nr:MAG: endonuclease [Candidatus Yonathbacteria bacterium CG17_big_fil_post_rev_8_21_14_2_50_43_9]PIR40578.1 MAG: endonuclease [Candidatus Yonathbacteria bacterium CG10_big_fil_rev_8_21_14_0_10_43_136]PIX56955.1 MAG: endonuclease [Candidatus Yonathbacteria bacterium CG_4_10_14_3_um_filter_43_12]PIY58092.1 MAG: endonuclease [Candidatus Yonathbacteria bacterium CG_4_10_14_0_8_um_filter_43_17]
MYKVYVLEDQISGMLYVGFTADLERRILEHKNGLGGKTTKGAYNWMLIYVESYVSKNDALGREKFLKGGSCRK